MKAKVFRKKAASALVLTLVTLTLLTIIALALTVSMKTARASARSFLDKTRAGSFSELGRNHAVALLRQMSGDTNRFWAVRPGLGYVSSVSFGGSNHPALDTKIPLSSGTSQYSDDPNLNIRRFVSTSDYVLMDTNSVLKVPWIYVYQDGTTTTNPPASYNSNNLAVGRYAFWVDTENNRINWNTAWKRSVTNTTANTNILSPDNVNLNVLQEVTTGMADQVRSYVMTNHVFNSPDEIRTIDETLDQNKFETTYFNHDPDTTYWGDPRIVLTTQEKLAGGRPFLDILKTPNSDPGLRSSIDVNKLNTVLQKLVTYFSRSDWPVGPNGASFAAKYFPALTASDARQHASLQLAIQIIDYVRAKESSVDLVEKIVGTINNGQYAMTWNDGKQDITSQSRQVCLTEMGVFVEPTINTTTGTFHGRIFLEIYLPENYGLDSVDLSKLWAKVRWNTSWYDYLMTGGSAIEQFQLTSSNVLIDGVTPGTTLQKGHYAVVSQPQNLRFTTRPANLNLKAYLFTNPNDTGASYIEEAPMISGYYSAGDGIILYPVDATDVPSANITSVEVDDPRINKSNKDWVRHAVGSAGSRGNTLGAINSNSTLGKTPTASATNPPEPQPDLDASGRITDASLYMPPPKGRTGNLDGRIHSVAEIGYVTTGCIGAYAKGIPWRTVRLGPTGQANLLPDWALLDLFALPRDPNRATEPQYRLGSTQSSYTNSVPGRINANALIAPFETGTPPAMSLERLQPLEAVFNAAALSSNNTPLNVSSNIYHHVLTQGGASFANPAITDEGYPYSFAGEIAEVAGIGDTGEAGENSVRQIVDLLTTRSNVFRIYSIGQAIRQGYDGSIGVVGEQRDCTIVERYLNATGAVEYGIIYQRATSF